IALELDMDTRLHGTVLGDAFRVRQILSNLIGNAYKFTETGFIKITAKIHHETDNTYKTEIRIADSGIGIRKEKQEQIFKEFTQAEEYTDKKYGGYGLGLTISKKLTELLNGKIGLKSEEGKGSTFILKIPFEISNTPIPIEPRMEILPPTKLSLLIVDDDPAMLGLLKEVCHHLDLTPYTYSNFYEIEKSADLDYNMVVTDIQMPNISGFEVLEKLGNGNYSHYNGQPVVAMTGRKDLEKTTYLKAGFADILQKPFTKDRFTSMLAELFPTQVTEVRETNRGERITSGSNLFSLEVISSFLGDDRDGIAEVLHTFMADTITSMDRLKNAIDTAELTEINSIPHKMLPMFRQLKVEEIIPTLERLETLKAPDLNIKELQQDYRSLKNGSTVLILAIKAYLAKDLNYSG
ncbi:MAG TPA: ATP-binding protein, partial [Arenibacter sp.]|nr:ATP-binding protein [Arenibacter sp.]